MLKKLPLAAAIAICAAFPTAAYASSIGGAVGGAVSAGGEIMDDAFDAGRDILNGFTARDNDNGADDLENDPDNTAGDNDPADPTPGGDTGTGDTASEPVIDNTTSDDAANSGDTTTSDDTTSSDDSTSSEDTVSGENDSMANSSNPGTGVSTLGYTAVAAVLAAMGVMTTAVRRKDDQ